MKFTKPALSLEAQVDLLIRRGMAVPDRARAIHFLQHISYYRLRAYWLPWEVQANAGDHAIRPGVSFDTIIDLYNFDRKLRLLVMDAIERIEVSLRTRWAYVLANAYGAHAFEDAGLFRDAAQHSKNVDLLQQELKRSHETFVQHYQNTYTDPKLPPIWVVCEVLTYGQLSKWFGNLRHGKDRVAIAEPYQLDEQILASANHHLAYVRNVCAHHSRLWNREMTIGMKLPKRPHVLAGSLNPQSPKRLYNTLVLLAYLMGQISPGSDWRKHLATLIQEHPDVPLKSMGFPPDWRERSIWKGVA